MSPLLLGLAVITVMVAGYALGRQEHKEVSEEEYVVNMEQLRRSVEEASVRYPCVLQTRSSGRRFGEAVSITALTWNVATDQVVYGRAS